LDKLINFYEKKLKNKSAQTCLDFNKKPWFLLFKWYNKMKLFNFMKKIWSMWKLLNLVNKQKSKFKKKLPKELFAYITFTLLFKLLKYK
jgi:hypothetical protein